MINRFNVTSNKIPMTFFAEIEKPILKFIGNLKGLQTVKIRLYKNNAGGCTLLDFKTYYKVTMIKTMRY